MAVTRRRISILGATGSIGTSTLDLVERDPEAFEVVALTAHSDVAGLADAARRTGAAVAVIGDESRYAALRDALAGTKIEVAAGAEAVAATASLNADWTMAAIVGFAGLRPTLAALKAGGTVALANKESLVAAGALVTDVAHQHGATLLPVDSEHKRRLPMFRSRRTRQHPQGDADRERRAVSRLEHRADGRGHTGAGGETSQLVDGREDIGRFGDADEQGA